ncbi:hypothetical protein P3709_11035 [Vibrio parahaemolyticus]|uniref:hypothetical protein n=1 Tax=Vibrio parahaemolyticus TaxID=670 RepID=UPI0004AEF24B|nr:hypothetical protein [Vibrio parahaemolyticus]EGQ8454442.1 hypothetical protein [Vibrio parahaemolyticus]MBE3709784.1 hypothetical protein [Vibrio parahaemolyticus]MBE3782047.1 hypothetical protein [Vibrio parahaemolyticus]MBE4250903.1 hypothetical protein [Vibrio parahaemolyticus]MBE4257978.1 hypothetical protein [Vibrio parahaemolyticus]
MLTITKDLEDQFLDLYARQKAPKPIFPPKPNTPDEFWCNTFKEDQSEDWRKSSSSA